MMISSIFWDIPLLLEPFYNRLSIDIQKQLVRLGRIRKHLDFRILHIELSSVFLGIEWTAKVECLSGQKHPICSTVNPIFLHRSLPFASVPPTSGTNAWFWDNVVEHVICGVLALQIRDLRLVLPLYLVKLFAVAVTPTLHLLMEFVNVLLSVCHKLAQLSVVLLHLLQFSTT